MPTVGRIKQLSALGVAIAALGVSASSASAANDVWLWACHGPSGQALDTTDPFVSSAKYGAQLFSYGDECADGAPGGLGGGGLSAVLSEKEDGANQPVAGNAEAFFRLDVPPNLKISKVKLQRETRGLSAAQEGPNPQRYTAKTLGGTLETISLSDATHADVSGEQTFDASNGPDNGDQVTLSLACESPINTTCPASDPVELDVSRVGIQVIDTSKPKFAVGGRRSPAAGELALDVPASDTGSGLRSATAYFEGVAGGPSQTVGFGGPGCEQELTPDDDVVDLPLGARCTMVGSAKLTIDTRAVPDGDYTLVVRVVDWAGNEEVMTDRVQVLNNVNLGTNTQTLNIGTSGVQQPAGSNNNSNNNNAGGVNAGSAQRCNSPRLSMFLSNKPLRVSKGVPVLKRGKRYRFNGRLTCVIDGKRKSAPKRARVDILNKIGKKTYEKAGTTVRDKGRLTVILSYKSSRLITFRFTNSDNRVSQVRIRVKVARR